MNDGGGGGAAPGVPPRAGGRRAASGAASASWREERPFLAPGASEGGIAAGGARGRRDLAGVSGLGGGAAASLVARSGLAQRPGNRAGGGPQIEGEILPAPEGVLRIFCRQRQAHCLCLTRLRHLLRGGGGAAKHPRTPRAAPHPPLGRRPAPAPRSPRRRRCAPRPRPAPRPGRRGRAGVEGFMAQSRTLIVGPGPAWFRLP